MSLQGKINLRQHLSMLGIKHLLELFKKKIDFWEDLSVERNGKSLKQSKIN